MVKVDLHVHSSCSPDSLLHVDKLIEVCDSKGIDWVAVTDHDAVECALKLHEAQPSRIIVGEEIHTASGELTGLFLTERIEPGLTPLETIDKIKEQGGLVYLPHPFDRMRAHIMKKEALNEIWQKIDIVEVFNSRNFVRWSNWKAASYAKEKGIAAGVGSDAHTQYELGMSYIIMEPFESADDFLLKLANADMRRRKTHVVFNLVTKIYKIAKGIG